VNLERCTCSSAESKARISVAKYTCSSPAASRLNRCRTVRSIMESSFSAVSSIGCRLQGVGGYRGVAQFSNTPSAVRLGHKQFHTVNPLSWAPSEMIKSHPQLPDLPLAQ